MPGRHHIFNSIPQNLSTMEQSVCTLPQSRWHETLQQKYLNLFKVSFPSYQRHIFYLFFSKTHTKISLSSVPDFSDYRQIIAAACIMSNFMSNVSSFSMQKPERQSVAEFYTLGSHNYSSYTGEVEQV